MILTTIAASPNDQMPFGHCFPSKMLELDDSTLAEKGISFKIKRKNE
jgi:hypothetical protein